MATHCSSTSVSYFLHPQYYLFYFQFCRLLVVVFVVRMWCRIRVLIVVGEVVHCLVLFQLIQYFYFMYYYYLFIFFLLLFFYKTGVAHYSDRPSSPARPSLYLHMAWCSPRFAAQMARVGRRHRKWAHVPCRHVGADQAHGLNRLNAVVGVYHTYLWTNAFVVHGKCDQKDSRGQKVLQCCSYACLRPAFKVIF